jgi:tetratricopeptide (TPR) repeat protein/transcriptional regulator with XRE-family HTH domain
MIVDGQRHDAGRLGAWLRQARSTAGMTQEELAEQSGVAVRTIGDLERGRTRKPYARSVRCLAAALGVPFPSEAWSATGQPPGSGADGAARAEPRQLPPAVRAFTGRTAEMAALTGFLDEAEAGRRLVVISAIGGTAGVGKTALAIEWAHQLAGRFPDGQLYVNLRGYDLGQAVPAAEVLVGFLRSLGVPSQDIPSESGDRAARYRSLLAGRRVLVVLDNAGSAEQVRPLLPGAPGCAALVTSRDALSGLVARDGARRVNLDLLVEAEAVGLLRTLIGDRVDADQLAAARLATQCCRLPLALRLAAELAAARPDVPLAELAGELADRQRRLDLLDADGDPRTAVRAVFSWSYRRLEPAAATTFRRLSLHPSGEIDRYAVATLAAVTAEQGGRLLDQLARAHLVQRVGPGRYAAHDLLRAYARSLADEHDPPEEQRAALTRLFDYYLYSADAAMGILYPAERHLRLRGVPAGIPMPPLRGQAAARTWLDAQRAGLVAVCAYMADHQWPDHATRLGTALHRYLSSGGHDVEAAAIYGHAYRAARRTGDRPAEATALSNLAVLDWQQGRYQQATARSREALALYREAGHTHGQACALNNLGLVESSRGRHQQAAGHYRQALALFREAGLQTGEECALANLGFTALQLGRYQQATGHYRRALALSRKIGHQIGTAVALNGLGEILLATGQPGQARAQHAAALSLAGEIGNQREQARALSGLGYACHALGQPEQGRRHWDQALALYDRLGALRRTGSAPGSPPCRAPRPRVTSPCSGRPIGASNAEGTRAQ